MIADGLLMREWINTTGQRTELNCYVVAIESSAYAMRDSAVGMSVFLLNEVMHQSENEMRNCDFFIILPVCQF